MSIAWRLRGEGVRGWDRTCPHCGKLALVWASARAAFCENCPAEPGSDFRWFRAVAVRLPCGPVGRQADFRTWHQSPGRR